MEFPCFTILLLVIAIGVDKQYFVEGCSCYPVHPQDSYCSSDFVIVARVKKNVTKDLQTIYKVNIKKEFKISEKAKVALKSGKIFTASHDAMCGVYLETGKVYILTGSIYGLQAHISICGYFNIWKNLTRRQRKGFRLIYSRGCDCKISHYRHVPAQKDICNWNDYECYKNHGICLRSPSGQCNWSKSLDLKKCLEDTPHSRDSRRRLSKSEPTEPKSHNTTTKFTETTSVSEPILKSLHYDSDINKYNYNEKQSRRNENSNIRREADSFKIKQNDLRTRDDDMVHSVDNFRTRNNDLRRRNHKFRPHNTRTNEFRAPPFDKQQKKLVSQKESKYSETEPIKEYFIPYRIQKFRSEQVQAS